MLDAQFAVDDVHPLDRSKMSMRRYHFHPEILELNLRSGHNASELRLVATAQNLGVRYWWACPVCGGRRRYIYFFPLIAERMTVGSVGVLGCRECLGLTYRTRSRHRCDDLDRERALDGDLKAAARALLRIDRKRLRDESFVEMMRQRVASGAHDVGESRQLVERLPNGPA